MRRSDVTYLTSCVFVWAYSLAYCLVVGSGLSVPRFFPLEGVWRMTKVPGVPSQGWYGMVAYAFVAGGLLSGAAYLALRVAAARQVRLSRAVANWAAGIAIVSAVLALAYLMHHEYAMWGVW